MDALEAAQVTKEQERGLLQSEKGPGLSIPSAIQGATSSGGLLAMLDLGLPLTWGPEDF